MPIYQYECSICKNTYEIKQGFEDPPLNLCPIEDCEGKPQKLISSVGVVFKGSGFYINDSKKQSNGQGKKDSSSEKTETTTSSSETSSSPKKEKAKSKT